MQKSNAGRVRRLNELRDLRSFIIAPITKIRVDHMYRRCTIWVERQSSKLVQKGINILGLTAEARQRPTTNATVCLGGPACLQTLSWGFLAGLLRTPGSLADHPSDDILRCQKISRPEI